MCSVATKVIIARDGNEVSSTSCPYAEVVVRDPDTIDEDEDDGAKAPIGVVYVLAATAWEMGNSNKDPAVNWLLDNLLGGEQFKASSVEWELTLVEAPVPSTFPISPNPNLIRVPHN